MIGAEAGQRDEQKERAEKAEILLRVAQADFFDLFSMPVTTISRRFCQRERSSPVESLRVMSFEPTASTNISAQVNTIVPLSLINPYRQKIISSGLRRIRWPPVPGEFGSSAGGRVSHVTTRRAMTNPRRHSSKPLPIDRRETK